MTADDDLNEVEACERRLLNPATRSSREDLDSLIADECVEFGRSGREWNKVEILESLPAEPVLQVEIDSIRRRKLSDEIVLITYRSRRVTNERDFCTLRSSVWQRREEGWKLVFHQGTPTQL